jgi:heat shock protein HslJ
VRYLLFIGAFLISSCAILKPASDQPRWRESVWNLTAIDQRQVNFGDKAFIKFDVKKNKISGKTLCNTFTSDYEMFTMQRIVISDISSTKMYCEGMMDEENKILTNLQKTKRYDVKADFLYLYADNGPILTFKRSLDTLIISHSQDK